MNTLLTKFTAARFHPALLSLPAIALASCATAENGDSASSQGAEQSATSSVTTQFVTDGEPVQFEDSGLLLTRGGEFERPWAIKFAPGTDMMFVTEKRGQLQLLNTQNLDVSLVSGTPEVAFGGQGGLGDVAFLESEADQPLNGRTIYLSWAETGDGAERGAAVGRGLLSCDEDNVFCSIEGLDVIWRQAPKVEGRGHYSHRISFSPDEQYMFIASGDRQKLTPAQDLTNTLGTIVRLNLDGSPAEGNPFADQGGVAAEIWSYGHRNILGMDWDADGRLWDIEHGPAGGDELNLVVREANYGWPTRSYGEHYNGDPIPDHSADDGFTKPAITWTPVIAPGDMLFYTGEMFADWQGDALIAGLSSEALVRVEIDGDNAREVARYVFGSRLRALTQGPDGSIWVAEDGPEARLFKIKI